MMLTKLPFKLSFLAVVAFSMTCLQTAYADVVVINLVPDATFNGSPNENTDQPSGTVFTSAGGVGSAIISTGIDGDLGTGRGTFTPFTLTGVDDTGAAVSGDFTIALTLTNSDGATIGRGGVGALGATTGNFITFSDVVLTNVSGDDVFQFDGFSSVFFGSADGTADTGSIEGVSVIPGFADNFIAAADEIVFADLDGVDSILTSVDVGNVAGTIAVNGLTAEFSVISTAVPEPSSLALLGLGAIGFISRRRR